MNMKENHLRRQFKGEIWEIDNNRYFEGRWEAKVEDYSLAFSNFLRVLTKSIRYNIIKKKWR